jgi:hypothetical protein
VKAFVMAIGTETAPYPISTIFIGFGSFSAMP